MAVEVKGVSDVVKEVKQLQKKAADVATGLHENVVAGNKALDTVKTISDQLADTTRELNELLGVRTNNPPVEEEDKSSRGRLEADRDGTK